MTCSNSSLLYKRDFFFCFFNHCQLFKFAFWTCEPNLLHHHPLQHNLIRIKYYPSWVSEWELNEGKGRGYIICTMWILLQNALGQGSFVIGMHALVCLQWVGYLVKVSLMQVNNLVYIMLTSQVYSWNLQPKPMFHCQCMIKSGLYIP